MALTKISTDGVKDDAITKAKIPADQIEASELANNAVDTNAIQDDAVTEDKLANSINSAIAANTAKDLTALSASNLTSGTVPDARFPATLPAVSGANLTNLPASGRTKNLIINGAMQVAQRATTYTGADNYNTVDRIKTIHSGLNEDVTSSQHELSSSDTPYSLGFRHSYHIQNGNQSGGAGAADLLSMQYRIEAQDVAQSGWNYKSASSFITLSFWVKSSVAQSFGCFLRTHDGTQLTFPFETGALTADAWTKITKTIPGNASMGFSTDNGTGIEINISQFWGTDYTASGQTLDAWSTYSNSARLKDFPASTWYDTDNATFEITGLQLEVGETASDFPHETFAETIQKCFRYFYKTYDYDTAIGTATSVGAFVYSLSVSQNYAAVPSVRYPVEMRDNPTVTAYSTQNANTTGKISADGTDKTTAIHYIGRKGHFPFINNSSSGVSVNVFLRHQFTVDSEL